MKSFCFKMYISNRFCVYQKGNKLNKNMFLDMEAKIAECQTLAELSTLEMLYVLSDYEQDLLFEKKVEIICRTAEWGMENEQVGLVANLSDSWTPEQRERFLLDWQNDEPLLEIDRGQKRSYEEMNDVGDEPLLQTGRGQKRSIDEVNDGAGTSDEVSNNNFFTMTDVKQVNQHNWYGLYRSIYRHLRSFGTF